MKACGAASHTRSPQGFTSHKLETADDDDDDDDGDDYDDDDDSDGDACKLVGLSRA